MRRAVHLAGRALAAFLFVAGVPLVVVGLVRWCFGVPMSAFRPVINDEVAYWHQALTFSQTGFHGGYYTLAELTNASGFTPFGPHGPGFAVAYGIVGTIFGWYRHSAVVLNLIAISVAALLWLRLTRVSTSRLLLAALVLMTFWPLIFWAPTGMQEGLHHAGAIAMAGFFAYALGGQPHRAIVAAGWIGLTLLSFIRPSWTVLIPIWAVVTLRPGRIGTVAATLAASCLFALAIVIAYSRAVAPFPTGFFFLKALDLSIGARALWDNVSFNVHRTFALSEYAPLEVLHRLQYWLWLVATIAIVGLSVVLRPGARVKHLNVAIASTAAALAVMFLLYTLTNWAEHRVLSAFLLFGVLMCVAAPGRAGLWLAAVFVASNIATSVMFVHAFDSGRRDNFIWDRRGIYELADALDGHVVYRPGAPRWCNTLLTSQYPPYLIAVPAGIGISVVREPDILALPPRSKYLLFDPPALADLKRPLRLEPLAVLPYGTLYRNLESECR